MNLDNSTPFRLPAPGYLRWLAPVGEFLLGLNVLDRYYRQRQDKLSDRGFLRYTLERLDIKYTIASGSLDVIPDSGPVIVVSNHPFGAIEGVMLAELLLQKRSNVKVLANEYLHRITEISDLFIGVDVFETNSAVTRNSHGLKKAIQHLKSDGVLLVFPAGEVSSLDFNNYQITDRKWNRIVGLMIRLTGATAVPVYIEGRNSRLFHVAGLIHSGLRTLLLVREMLNKRNKTIQLHFGEAITSKELKPLSSDKAITSYLRLNTYLLAGSADNKQGIKNAQKKPEQAIALPVAKNLLFADVAAIPADCLLIKKNEYEVYCTSADKLRNVLPEIARLREITFRQVDEGTGLASDTDKYDESYLHMFIWNREQQEIVGAYRMGLVDKLLANNKLDALYSKSLFNFDERFLKSLGGSIELGRSFIRIEYQRQLGTLLLLWKGLTTYAARHPRYTTFFGPVSISNSYSKLSRSLLVNYLEIHHYDEKRAQSIKPVNPRIKPASKFWTRNMLREIGNGQLISKLIYRMEGDKGLPVLLRQYLNMKGRLVCFNVDRKFNDSLDGLIIVDLLQAPEKLLGKYMGKQQAINYLNRK